MVLTNQCHLICCYGVGAIVECLADRVHKACSFLIIQTLNIRCVAVYAQRDRYDQIVRTSGFDRGVWVQGLRILIGVSCTVLPVIGGTAGVEQVLMVMRPAMAVH